MDLVLPLRRQKQGESHRWLAPAEGEATVEVVAAEGEAVHPKRHKCPPYPPLSAAQSYLAALFQVARNSQSPALASYPVLLKFG
jgi:hypothetical protein